MISPEERNVLRSFAARIPPNDPGAHNNLAIVYYNKGLFDEALEELEVALKVDPNFVLARNNLELLLKKTGRLEEKVEQLARTAQAEPYDERRTLEIADTYRKLNRYSQAIVFYRKVLDSNQGSCEAHYGLGITLKLLGKYDDALNEIKRAQEIKSYPELFKILGEIYFNKGVIDLAIKNFQEAIAMDPSSAESHFLLGFALGEKGKFKESVQAVKKAIQLNPALAQFEPNLPIDIEKHKGHWEFLKEELGLPKLGESEYQMHYNMGMTYRNKGLFNEANKELEACLKINADNPDVYLILGEVNVFLNKLEDAVAYLRKAHELHRDSARCTNALGVAVMLNGNIEGARTWFLQALQLNSAAAFNNSGVIKYTQGNADAAVHDFKKAVEYGDRDARFNLAMHHMKKGDYDAALALFDGGTADGLFGKGLIYVELGKNDEALECFNQTLALVPYHAGANYNIGFVLTKTGKFKEGLNYIRRGIEIEPNYAKDKHRLSLGPEYSEFGLHYALSATPGEGAAIQEPVPEVEKPRADQCIVEAEQHVRNYDFEKALTMTEKALGLDPSLRRAAILKARILFETGNVADATNFLSVYLKQFPGDREILNTLGRMLRDALRFDEAKKVYDTLLADSPDDVDVLAERAEIAFNLNEVDEAVSLYNRICAQDNGNVAAHLGFLKIYMKSKDYDRAAFHLNAIKDKQPELYEFHLLAGIYYAEQRHHDEAIKFLEKAIHIDPSRPLPYYHIGLLKVQRGDFDSACDNWKKALLLSPDKDLTKRIGDLLNITVELSEVLKKGS